MPDLREVFQMSTQKVQPDRGFAKRQEFRQRRRMRNRKIGAYAMVAAIVAIAVVAIAEARNGPTPPVPADDPTPTERLGIFAPVAGRIVYVNGTELGYSDLGYAGGLWAVDPDASRDTVEGPTVADDVASALVRLGSEDAIPLGWSSDGTELLLIRSEGSGSLLPEQYLSILHADGSETRLNEAPMGITGATISPDGRRVVFAGQYNLSGLYVIDAEGGRPVPLPIPQVGEGRGEAAGSPTFSPDGTQIAYLAGNTENHVWVADADGSNAHEILANVEVLSGGGASGMQWSPAGDRIAIQLRSPLSGNNAIYTIAPDGSDLTPVVTGADSPYWSPDGSQIAYSIVCDEQPDGCGSGNDMGGLAIADADGSNVRELGFAASGPWHPGE